jgi:hypothetical protein
VSGFSQPAKARQSAERLAVGSSYRSGEYVVSNEVGDPYHPQVLSRYCQDAVKAAGLRPIKLHAARHTAATAMHLSGVPVAVIAAWIGHRDASPPKRLYAHSQDDAIKAAGDTRVDIVATTRPGIEHLRTVFSQVKAAGDAQHADDHNEDCALGRGWEAAGFRCAAPLSRDFIRAPFANTGEQRFAPG